MKRGRAVEAREILDLLNPTEPETVEKEYLDIEIALGMTHKSSWATVFSIGPQRIFHQVVLASTAQMFLQMSGINAITYYASSIYETDLGFPAREAEILAAASQFAIIIGSTICSFTVDRFGRRSLMLFSAAAMSACFAIEAGLLSINGNPAALKAAVFVLYLYYVVYTIGFLGIPFLYASEVAPTQVRAAVCGVSTAVSWTFNFVVSPMTQSHILQTYTDCSLRLRRSRLSLSQISANTTSPSTPS